MAQRTEEPSAARVEDDATVERVRELVAESHSEAALIKEIKPSRGWISLDLKGVWRYHELLFFLIWRDVKVRYKQTAIGVVWVVLQPVTTMLVFTFVFGRLANIPTQDIPYPLFAFSGLLPWQLFTSGLMGAGTSIVGNAGLISKVYFPRLIIPITAVIAGIVDFIVSFGILVALLLYYGTAWRWQIVTLPLFVLLTVIVAFSVGVWLSLLNVRYRDVQQTIPYLVQVWLFLTPIAYTTGLIPPKYKLLVLLNPMTSVVDGFRWALFGKTAQFGGVFFVSIAIVLVVGLLGVAVFKRSEKRFADLI